MSDSIPESDSIEELARFWDTHDLTDFEDQLEEVAEPVMERTKERLLDELIAVAQEVPEDKLQEIIDFTEYLKSKYRVEQPQRGSAAAILQALERIGPLEFEPGELDMLLTDIEQMRALDLAEDDRLSS